MGDSVVGDSPMVPRQIARGFNVGCGTSGRQYSLRTLIQRAPVRFSLTRPGPERAAHGAPDRVELFVHARGVPLVTNRSITTVAPRPGPGARSEGDDPPQFLIVHAIAISNDGFVYVADREYGRIQIFTIDGEFVDQMFMPRNARGNARAGDVAFSADPQQEFMYVTAGAQIVVIRRRSLEILYSFSGSGHHIATDSEGNLYTA